MLMSLKVLYKYNPRLMAVQQIKCFKSIWKPVLYFDAGRTVW